MPNLDETGVIIAYQKSTLFSLQRLYENLRGDLDNSLEQEAQISKEIETLREGLTALCNAPASPSERRTACAPQERSALSEKTYPRIIVPSTEQFDELVQHAAHTLHERRIDLNGDPLLQVLDAKEIVTIAESYTKTYGDISWDQADYLVVMLAGIIGTLLDIFLIKIPGTPKFLLNLPQGYAMTSWLKENAQRLHADLLLPISGMAATYFSDTPKGDASEPSVPAGSKDDAMLRFIFGMIDLARHNGTGIDQHGNVTRSECLNLAEDDECAMRVTRLLLTLFSDVFCSAGIDLPFGSLNALLSSKAEPHSDKANNGSPLSWKKLDGYLGTHGYNVRDFLITGIIPAAIEAIIQGYWLLKCFDTPEHIHQLKVKTTSMLLSSHALTLSGNLLKSGVLFQLNPLFFNWDAMLRFLPLTISWINEGVEREHRIRSSLDAEWLNLYQHIHNNLNNSTQSIHHTSPKSSRAEKC